MQFYIRQLESFETVSYIKTVQYKNCGYFNLYTKFSTHVCTIMSPVTLKKHDKYLFLLIQINKLNSNKSINTTKWFLSQCNSK